MREFVRGAAVEFYNIQFRDSANADTVPESAVLLVRYLKCGREQTAEIDLDQSEGLWNGEWDSSDADPGTIYWHVKSTSPEAIVAEGEFRLRANPANPRG